MNTNHTQFDVTQMDLSHLFLNHFLICFDIKKRKKNVQSGSNHHNVHAVRRSQIVY